MISYSYASKLPRLCRSLSEASVSLTAAEGWLTDLDEGLKVAKAEKKAVLVDFTGSDWCGWCIRLKKEVFDQKEFAAVTKDFVLVELDYPRRKSRAPRRRPRTRSGPKKFAIEGYPTIMLLNADGEPFAQTGYQAGGPVKCSRPSRRTPEGEHRGRRQSLRPGGRKRRCRPVFTARNWRR
jgi:protein disulfide-isomerase